MRTFALLPAAGQSARMGRPKLALPLGGRSVLEAVIDTLRQGGVAEILVVLGPHVAQLVPLARSAGAHVLLLDENTTDMRATVERGLDWLQERFLPALDDRWLLVPADHPALEADVVRRIVAAEGAGASIVVPTFQGKRGHPVRIGWQHVAPMRALPAGEGLNVYLRGQAAGTLELPVESESILCDLDTPADYERLRQSRP